MFELRQKRVAPLKDTKILTDWNGLMIAALAKSARAFHRPDLADAAVRAADLAGLAGEYKDFVDRNRRFKKESEMLSGEEISWNEWKKQTTETVAFYLKQDIHLTSHYEDTDGTSIFHKKTRENLERFLNEDESVLEKE